MRRWHVRESEGMATRVVSALLAIRTLAAVAMLFAVVAGALGLGEPIKIYAAGAGATLAALMKAAHAL